MGLLDFLAGWSLGAKTGNQGFDDVVETAKAIFESKEFRDFVDAGRNHVAFALRELSDLVAVDEHAAPGEDLVEFVRALAAKRDAWASAAAWPPPGRRPRRPDRPPPD